MLRTIGLSIGLLLPFFGSESAACFIASPSKQPARDEADDAMLASVRRLSQIFEAQIVMNNVPGVWELKVRRVFLGSLKQGQILRGTSSRDICSLNIPEKGDRGLILAGWGQEGLDFGNSFVNAEGIASLKRVGILPPDYGPLRTNR
ncbi:hypothetical protein ASE86_06025 [Sphingomonas sp. Leaf33]|uniref:hypothetical protein n=1 Tax=Sphingomonas sp. Leaf33 TaxID=1736215 RepID=UPI0006F65B1E|nr:hypothetical protein [Sphingomonas sp. Leaf33]KQN25760.1 hypothetical protein ASE86_06025 [Sphingomonas sp. Leaf33]